VKDETNVLDSKAVEQESNIHFTSKDRKNHHHSPKAHHDFTVTQKNSDL
jgi:hypothetical protein